MDAGFGQKQKLHCLVADYTNNLKTTALVIVLEDDVGNVCHPTHALVIHCGVHNGVALGPSGNPLNTKRFLRLLTGRFADIKFVTKMLWLAYGTTVTASWQAA